MRVVQRSVKSVLLRHSKSRTLVSVSKSPLRVPVTCRATSGAQSAWPGGPIVLHQTRTAPNAAAKTTSAAQAQAAEKRDDCGETEQHEQAAGKPSAQLRRGEAIPQGQPGPGRRDRDGDHKNCRGENPHYATQYCLRKSRIPTSKDS